MLKHEIKLSLPSRTKGDDPSNTILLQPVKTSGSKTNSAGSKSRGDGKKSPSRSNGRSGSQVMFVSDPFEAQFSHWSASKDTWDVVFAV